MSTNDIGFQNANDVDEFKEHSLIHGDIVSTSSPTTENSDEVKRNISHMKGDNDGSDLAAFFATPDDVSQMPLYSFKFNLLRVKNTDLVEMVRSSCKLMAQNSKYIDINYDYIAEYSQLFNHDAIDNFEMNKKNWAINMEEMDLSERDIINISCFFVILQIGYGFRKLLAQHCKHEASHQISIGVRNMYKKYPKLDCESLNKITIVEVSQLFEIPFFETYALQVICEMIRNVIQEVINTLAIKNFNTFADYIYYHIDLCWIKSQTKNLSAIETIKWINDDHKLELTFAAAESKIVRRCILTDFIETKDNSNNETLKRLVENKAFIYAINGEIVYRFPFDEIMQKLQHLLDKNSNNIIVIEFGLHGEEEGITVQTLLYNLITDFKGLRDVYLYESLFTKQKGQKKKNLKIYLFQRCQLIVMELYYNLFLRPTKSSGTKPNPIFNFKDIGKLTPVVDNIIPFVLMKDGIIQVKQKYKQEWNKWMKSDRILKKCELEVELKVCALWAIELLLNYRKSNDINYQINATQFCYFLWAKGKQEPYCSSFTNHDKRDSIYY